MPDASRWRKAARLEVGVARPALTETSKSRPRALGVPYNCTDVCILRLRRDLLEWVEGVNAKDDGRSGGYASTRDGRRSGGLANASSTSPHQPRLSPLRKQMPSAQLSYQKTKAALTISRSSERSLKVRYDTVEVYAGLLRPSEAGHGASVPCWRAGEPYARWGAGVNAQGQHRKVQHDASSEGGFGQCGLYHMDHMGQYVEGGYGDKEHGAPDEGFGRRVFGGHRACRGGLRICEGAVHVEDVYSATAQVQAGFESGGGRARGRRASNQQSPEDARR
ncbi:hypothetical protein BKA93DRAFT_838698 [Sparassis latifolia]